MFVGQLPLQVVAPTLYLFRKRLGLSREVSDDVVRARGRVAREHCAVDYTYKSVSLFDEKRHGPLREWTGFEDDDDVLDTEIMYVDDKKHGLERSWDCNGILLWEISYIADKQHGISRGWHENGTLHWETQHIENKRHGLSRWWHEDGRLASALHYVHGLLTMSTNYNVGYRCY